MIIIESDVLYDCLNERGTSLTQHQRMIVMNKFNKISFCMDIKEASDEMILKVFCGDSGFKKDEKSGRNRKQFYCLNEMKDFPHHMDDFLVHNQIV